MSRTMEFEKDRAQLIGERNRAARIGDVEDLAAVDAVLGTGVGVRNVARGRL
jgi:hypothetical protein